MSAGRQSRLLADRAPNQSTTVESGVASGAKRATWRATGTVSAVGGRPRKHDAVADNGDVPLSVAVIFDGTDRRVGDAQSGDAPTEQRWRHQRGDEDDDQQGGVLIVAEDSLGEADRGEDDPDLAAWDHPDADEQPIDTQAAGAAGRRQLAEHGDDEQRGGQTEHRWPGHRGEVGVEADLHEEHRDQHVGDGAELALDASVVIAAPDRQAGDEGADDRRQVGPRGRPRERQHEPQGDDDEGRRRPRPPVDRPEDDRDGHDPRRRGDHEEADRPADRAEDRQGVDVVARHDLDDHGEDQQAEDVVGDRRAEDDPRLGGRQGAQVTEHPRRDPDAGCRERRADEQGGVAGLAETEGDTAAEHERHGNADHGDGHRGATDATQFREVHLHPDLHEEQQDAEFGKGDDRFAVGRDPAEHGRPDQDADDDLADDSRNVDPLAQFGGELGGDQDHRQVEQHRPSVGTRRRPDPARQDRDIERSHRRNAPETRPGRRPPALR